MEIKKLLIFLDDKIGIDNYTLFLTADHGALEVPAKLRDEGVDADAIGKIPEVQPWLEETENDGRVNEKAVWEAMKTCYDPEIPVNIYELGLIYKIEVLEEKKVYVEMTLTSPNCPVAESLPAEVKEKVKTIPAVQDVDVEIVFEPVWTKDMMSEEAKLELGML